MLSLYNFFILVFTLQKNQKQQQQIFEKNKSLYQSTGSVDNFGFNCAIVEPVEPECDNLTINVFSLSPGIAPYLGQSNIDNIDNIDNVDNITNLSSTPNHSNQKKKNYPAHTIDAFLVFDIHPLLEHLSYKNDFIVFQCLDALKAIDIECYKKTSLAHILHRYYMRPGHGINCQNDFKYFKCYFKQLNKSTLSQVITGAKKEYQDKIIDLDFKRKLSEFEYKETIQKFFHYIDNNYTPPTKDSFEYKKFRNNEPIDNIEIMVNPIDGIELLSQSNELSLQKIKTDCLNAKEETIPTSLNYCLDEVRNFFKQQNFSVKEVEDLNQNNFHSINYFGSFLHKLLNSNMVSGEFLIKFLSAVFLDQTKAISFLVSLSGRHMGSAIFKNMSPSNPLLIDIFECFEAKKSKNVGVYHFARNFNIVCVEQNPLDLLYVFDNLDRLTQNISYHIQKKEYPQPIVLELLDKVEVLVEKNTVQYKEQCFQLLKNLKIAAQDIQEEENEKYIEFEHLVLMRQMCGSYDTFDSLNQSTKANEVKLALTNIGNVQLPNKTKIIKI